MDAIEIDRLIRSKRTTLHLEIGTDAKLTVRVPLFSSERIIQNFVENNRDWILRRQKYAREHCKPASPKNYIPGEEFLYMGKLYKLVFSDAMAAPLIFDGEYFILNGHLREAAPELFRHWYKQKAFEIIAERADLYSTITTIKHNKIRITNARYRWGSCSINGNLNFTWSLIMAPLEVIDCVVVHELVHIKVKGHSDYFWQQVKDFIPGVAYCRKWLNENQNLLSL